MTRKTDKELDDKFSFLYKRNDDIYTDIENFQQHEYTTCIIYEMFRRANKDIKRQYNYEDDTVHILPQRISDIVLFIKDGLFTLQNIIYELFPQLEDDIKSILSKHHKIPLENYHEINNLFLNYSIDLNYLIVNYIERYKKQQESELNKVIFKEVEYFDKSKNMKIKVDIDELERIISSNNTITTVIPYYKRPQVFLKKNYLVNINLLNLALPEKELFDFIKQLKKEIKNETIVINKFIKGTKFPNHYFIEKKTITKSNHKSTIFEYKNSSKMADMFFIYDAFKDNVFKYGNLEPYDDLIQFIQKEIYNSRNIAPSKYIGPTTINNYKETAEHYIDNKHYSTLLDNLQ